jgi:hypothetical protein
MAKRKPRRKPCPHCGSRDTGRIIWGLVVPDPDHPWPEHVVLGGCCIDPGYPQRECHTCGRRYDFADELGR